MSTAMWTELKEEHAEREQRRWPIVLAAIGIIVGVALMTLFTQLVQEQVQKAQLRESTLSAQRVAAARCLEESARPISLRQCMDRYAQMPQDDVEVAQTGTSAQAISSLRTVSFATH